MATAYRLEQLAEHLGAEVRGDPRREIRGIATLEEAGPHDLSFLTNPRYRPAAETTRAGALLVGPGCGVGGRDLLVARQPYAALAAALELFHPERLPPPGVSPDARLGSGVRLGERVHVGPFAVVGDGVALGDRAVVGAGVVIGDGCAIGPDTRLHPGAVLYGGTRVGARCRIHAGVVLGADGFGFATLEDGEHRKVPQVGRVVIEDDVEIGANTTVDRAMLGATTIGAGTKIDDLVLVAHGVRIGARSLLAGQAGIAGSARLGARAILAGQSGVAGHLELGPGVVIAAKSAVFEDLPAGATVAGIPAIERRSWRRAVTALGRLPELRRALRALRARLEALERRLGEPR